MLDPRCHVASHHVAAHSNISYTCLIFRPVACECFVWHANTPSLQSRTYLGTTAAGTQLTARSEDSLCEQRHSRNSCNRAQRPVAEQVCGTNAWNRRRCGGPAAAQVHRRAPHQAMPNMDMLRCGRKTVAVLALLFASHTCDHSLPIACSRCRPCYECIRPYAKHVAS
jgi:hypothetical protein